MHIVPFKMNTHELTEKIIKLDNVVNIHDIHIWNINHDTLYGSMHVSIYENNLKLLDEIKKILHDYNIHSSTIQFELYDATNEKNLCYDIVCSNTKCTI